MQANKPGRRPKHNVRRFRDTLRDLTPEGVDKRSVLGRAAKKFKAEMKERYFFDGWGPEQDHDLEAATHYHLRVVRDGPLIESWTGDRKDLASLQADYDAGVRQRAAALGRLRDAQEAATKDTIPEILKDKRERRYRSLESFPRLPGRGNSYTPRALSDRPSEFRPYTAGKRR